MRPVTRAKGARSGFTLMELAIIIAIVGILAAVGAVKYADMMAEAKKAGADSVLANCRSALAIAIAKDTDGKVTFAEYQTYMAGATALSGTTMTVADSGKTYSATVTVVGGGLTGIESVATPQ